MTSHMPSLTPPPALTTRPVFIALTTLMVWGCSKPEDRPEEITPEMASCERDTIESEADAVALSMGTPQEGFVCPVEDVDWFSYDVPASHSILRLNLQMGAPLSPVEPNYSIWSANNGAKDTLIAQPITSRVGAAFSESHCVSPGPVLIKIHDLGDDTQDVRYKYSLDVTSREDIDKQEPNEEATQAVELSSGQPITAAVSCQGDKDWYKFTLPQGSLLKLTLTSDVAGYEPTMRILDAEQNQLIEELNKAGSIQPTEIERFEVLNGAGEYYVVISDDDDEQANPDVPYTIIAEFISDQDDNEPNNNPTEATPIVNTPLNCQNNSQEYTFTGTIGAESDQDWFELPLQDGCAGRILDAVVELNDGGLSTADAWEFQQDFQISLSMIREHKESTCTSDSECSVLQLPCSNDLDCAGYYDTCLPEGLCAGATACLPGGLCAANQVIRSYECNPRLAQCQPGGGQAPPAMRAEISAPLLANDRVYLKVNDFQSDKAASDRVYTLRVRVRVDSDTAEPSNLFLNELPRDGLSGRPHRSFARDITVHDCTAGDCCNDSTWVDGSLAYENDLDWFRYPHPCPGEDCTMRMRYDVDGGPVDFVLNLYRNDTLWFTGFDNEELETQGAIQGTLGGMTTNDTCFYAYQGHQGNNDNPFYYYIVLRDLLDLYEDPNVSQRIPIPNSKDWSGGQRYRFCVEKISNICSEPPCQLYDDGCGQPQ